MNINQILENPQLFTTLTDQQKLKLYQDLQQEEQRLTTLKTKTQAQLEEKQAQQQTLLKQLQDLTGKQTLKEIQQYITDLQTKFDQELLELTNQYSQLHKDLPI